MTAEATAARVDGRTRRRRRNVDAVVEAVIELADDGNADPTSEDIAAVAGISHRSIYRYFDTRADLLDAAVTHAFDGAMADAFGAGALDGAFDARVDRFVTARLEISRRLRAVVRVAQAHHASGALERARTALRMRLADDFATEFDELPAEERRLALPMIDAAFQFEALEYLSQNAELDDASLEESLSRHVRRHLGRDQ